MFPLLRSNSLDYDMILWKCIAMMPYILGVWKLTIFSNMKNLLEIQEAMNEYILIHSHSLINWKCFDAGRVGESSFNLNFFGGIQSLIYFEIENTSYIIHEIT